MTRLTVGEASLEWRDTYIGYSLEDMTKWWVVARWGDERLLFDEEYAKAHEMDYSKPWWTPWCIGDTMEGTDIPLLYEVLQHGAWCWDNFNEASLYADEHNVHFSLSPDHIGYLRPLNIGDYIRWEDKIIDNHKMRKLADPIYKSSQRFFAAKPTE